MKLNKFIIFIALGLIFAQCNRSSDSSEGLDLAGEDWSLGLSDMEEYSSQEISHSAWETVSLPSNLYKFMEGSNGTIWLRKSFDYNISFVKGNPSVYLGNVFEKDEVYINGILVGINGEKSVNFGRKRIYPIPPNILVDGENLIAIRLTSGLNRSAGILTLPIGIYPIDQALRSEWENATTEFIYISFFFFIGIFYLLNYYRMKESKEYLSFSIFAFVYCLYEFARNDFRFNIVDNFLLFKFLEYSTLFFIPYLFIRFVENFLKFPHFKYSRIYLLVSAVFVLVFAVVQNHRFWFNFIGFWDIHLPLALSYTVYLTFQKIKDKMVGAYIHMVGLVYIFYAILKQILIERGFLTAESSVETSLLFYFFVMTLALRMQFLFIKRQILGRYDQLKEADSLREKVFNHMDLMISSPLQKMFTSIQEILISKDSKLIKEKILEIEEAQSSLQPLMDDIIELSRLEVLKEVPFKASVPFVDFIKEVIPDDSITYSINVDPDTMIENSLELINSIVIRLIDFPGIRNFTHNDLIITQDLKGNVHFRFLLFHVNPKIAIRLYNELSNKSSLEDSNTIKWHIIRQIARLLEAKLELKIIKRKYLRIDLGLKAIPVPPSTLESVPDSQKKKAPKFQRDWLGEIQELGNKILSKFKKTK